MIPPSSTCQISCSGPATRRPPSIAIWSQRSSGARTSSRTSCVARCGEIAIRLATIRAAGRWGRGAAVDATDMEWAAGVAWIAGQAMADAIVDQMPDTERGIFADKLLEIIRRREEVTVRDIQMTIRGRLRSAEIKDILRQLIEAGAVKFTPDGKYRAAN
jgi:hypothetical protein